MLSHRIVRGYWENNSEHTWSQEPGLMKEGQGSGQVRQSVYLCFPSPINPRRTPRLWLCDAPLNRKRQNSLEHRSPTLTTCPHSNLVDSRVFDQSFKLHVLTNDLALWTKGRFGFRGSGVGPWFAFLTRSQVMPILPVPRPHFESHSTKEVEP